MKNILKIALVAISANCNADAANIIKNMSDHRMNFEHRVMSDIFTEVNSPRIKQIMQGLQGAKLKGMILHDFDVKGTQTEKADILVSLHNTEIISYHIIKKSNDLKSLVDKPSKGYHLFTDELKNSINANEQKSEFKSKFHVAPLRRAALKEAFENPGTFDHVKFVKEKQLTPEFMTKTLEETFEQVNIATDIKESSNILLRDIHKAGMLEYGAVDAQANIAFINNKIDAFIDNMMPHIKDHNVNISGLQIIPALEGTPSTQMQNAFKTTAPFLMEHRTGVHSRKHLKNKCESVIYKTLFTIYSQLSISDLISTKFDPILSSLSNHSDSNHNDSYNYQNAMEAINQLKAVLATTGLINNTLKQKINQLIDTFMSKLKVMEGFDSSEEEADAMYLDELSHTLPSADFTYMVKSVNISGQYKMVVNLFDNDWTFPNISYFENKDLRISSLINSDIRYETIFGCSLYNSKMSDSLKRNVSYSRGVIQTYLQESDNPLSLNEKLKDALSSDPVSKSKLNTFKNRDFFNLCTASSTVAYINSNTFFDLQALINHSLTSQP